MPRLRRPPRDSIFSSINRKSATALFLPFAIAMLAGCDLMKDGDSNECQNKDANGMMYRVSYAP